jgi:phosphatidyl-myo-inositol alpha-mannosyltransferase
MRKLSVIFLSLLALALAACADLDLPAAGGGNGSGNGEKGNAVFTVSDAAADYLRRMTDEPIRIVPNGIDLTRFRPPRERRDKVGPEKTILYVGRLEPRKGVKYLFYAFARLHEKQPQLKLKLLGDGSGRRKLEYLAEDLGLDDSVEFMGYRSDSEKLRLLRSADLFCSPALHGESFGVVLLEAMATGLVTVAGDNPGYDTVMKGFGAVSLINPKHTDDFARRLELLLNDTGLRRLWRGWAKSEVQQYDFPQLAKRYEAVYNDVLKKSA